MALFVNALNVVSAVGHWRAAQATGFSSEANYPRVSGKKIEIVVMF